MLQCITFAVCVLHLAVVVSNAQQCKNCDGAAFNSVCGTDGQTYRSRCDLERIACKERREVHVDCERKCPCDPAELSRMDNETVQALAQLRREMEDEKDAADYNSNTVLGAINREPIYLQQDACTQGEMKELPRRLIDWFHVLKTNLREEQYNRSDVSKELPLKRMEFLDGKLKAMYSKLACADNDDIVEKEVCLEPVEWFFNHLDSDNSKTLNALELSEMVEISNEHCIQPFLEKSCDRDGDGSVKLVEFCKCLCYTPPCSIVLEKIPTVKAASGKWIPFHGYFTPQCDEDGFFMPHQHNKRKGEHWCVDRNGNEIVGTRDTKKPVCDINTRWQLKYKKLIPLDLYSENSPEVVANEMPKKE